MYIVKCYIISVPKYDLMGNGWKWVEMGKFFLKSTDMDGFGFEQMGRNGLGPKILPHEGLYVEGIPPPKTEKSSDLGHYFSKMVQIHIKK